MDKIIVLFTGATGYVGGNILCQLLSRPDADRFEFRAIVRSAEKAEKLKGFGIVPIIGSHLDEGVMVKATSEADIVLLVADSDDVQMINLILLGLKKLYQSTGKATVLINTSGTAILADDAAGMYASDVVWDDASPEQLETLSPTAPHRPVDLRILAADEEGYIKSYIVAPSLIYAISRNPLSAAGISKSHNRLWDFLIPVSLQRGQGGRVGEGKNIWPNVHIDDLAILYDLLLDSIIKNPSTTLHGREGVYFAHSDEHKFYDVYKRIAEVMFNLGKGETADPTPFSEDELKRLLVADLLGCNSRCKSSNAAKLGWKPVKTTKDFLDSIEAEVKHQLASA